MEPILLYSINSRLAYNINKRYYKKHYVWCATKFNTNDNPVADRNNPDSSNPFEILKTFNEEIKKVLKDLHHTPHFLIERLNGVLYGLEINRDCLGEELCKDLSENIKQQRDNNTIWQQLKPVIYVIPYSLVKDRITPVPPSKTAGILSEEYILTDLKDEEFDVITDFGEIKL
ncbi:MAG: hypothetical protein IJC01_04100 [Clostridia bacterium]|nr:hypothetical protein [Clostridia bacterium]